MEVHAHTHTARKKWTHYFWEFLMLFLAVFCGFLAEYQLEHVIENQREKKYAASLLEDLKNDTADLKNDIPFWERYNSRIDTIRNEIEKEPATRDQLLLYRCVRLLLNNNTFQYNDRTIGQLKYAGNFRLIREKIVTDSLIEYDAQVMNQIGNIQNNYNVLAWNRRELEDQLFNTKFFNLGYLPEKLDSAAKQEPEIITIIKGKEDLLLRYYNSLYTLSWITTARIRFLKRLLERATTLIEIIEKEYRLK